jgi:cell fate (sporulation/competence/biofilm development) regulator YlbF (YheA/YmcA/DUF963 family)
MELINNLQSELENIKSVLEKYNKVKEYRKRNNQIYHVRYREKVNEYNRNYIKNRYKNDPEFREKMKQSNKEYRERQKVKKIIELMNNEEALFDCNEELNLIIS